MARELAATVQDPLSCYLCGLRSYFPWSVACTEHVNNASHARGRDEVLKEAQGGFPSFEPCDSGRRRKSKRPSQNREFRRRRPNEPAKLEPSTHNPPPKQAPPASAKAKLTRPATTPLLQRKKTFIVLTGLLSIINSTLGTSLPANAAPSIGSAFAITDGKILTLPITTYLIGYIFGPLLFGPLSEVVGRRPVILWTYLLFTAFTLGCALAPTFAALCVFRLLVGVFASAPAAVIGGLYADVFADPVTRGRALSVFLTVSSLAMGGRAVWRGLSLGSGYRC